MAGWPAVRSLLGLPGPALDPNPDWMTLRHEGLLCLVADQMIQAGLPIPSEVRDTLWKALAFEMRCRSSLDEISRAAHERGLQVLAFKGCSLAFGGVYSRPAQRSFGDIDLAVRPAHRQGLADLLEQLGFTQLGTGFDCIFTCHGLILDLHEHPLQQLTQVVGPRAQEWWQAAEPLSKHTGTTLRLAHEHEFLLALFHGAKHSFSRANWLVDLALLAQRVEPDRLAQAVRRFRAQRQLSYAAACLQQWFAVPLPGELSRGCRWGFLERRFVKLVLQRRAPDFLGSLTPLASAHTLGAALSYLLNTLYPAEIPPWQRTRQLLVMARTALRAGA